MHVEVQPCGEEPSGGAIGIDICQPSQCLLLLLVRGSKSQLELTMHFPRILLALPCLAATAAGSFEKQRPLTEGGFTSMPLLGFGTWNLHGENATQAVSIAIQTGYRHIDCATAYGNQKEVGAGIADGIKKAGIKRSQLWITSKLWNTQYGFACFVLQDRVAYGRADTMDASLCWQFTPRSKTSGFSIWIYGLCIGL